MSDKIGFSFGITVTVVSVLRQEAEFQSFVFLGSFRVRQQIVAETNLIIISDSMDMDMKYPTTALK